MSHGVQFICAVYRSRANQQVRIASVRITRAMEFLVDPLLGGHVFGRVRGRVRGSRRVNRDVDGANGARHGRCDAHRSTMSTTMSTEKDHVVECGFRK